MHQITCFGNMQSLIVVACEIVERLQKIGSEWRVWWETMGRMWMQEFQCWTGLGMSDVGNSAGSGV